MTLVPRDNQGELLTQIVALQLHNSRACSNSCHDHGRYFPGLIDIKGSHR